MTIIVVRVVSRIQMMSRHYSSHPDYEVTMHKMLKLSYIESWRLGDITVEPE